MDKEQLTFHEHNNRKVADKFAEYITGDALRRFVADTVIRFTGKHPSVLDGAAGSGQLEQYISPSEFEAVEIQEAACIALQHNYPGARIHHTSFFLYEPERQMDCAVMNPPFSLKFKDLPDKEKLAVQRLFPWKKSGVLDDIFILKSLDHVRRWNFQIAFPGIAYRKTEARMRQIIGNRLAELWTVKSAFEDTNINVIFFVIDKEKTSPHYQSAVYDCATRTVLYEHIAKLDENCDWPLPAEHNQQEPPLTEDQLAQLNNEVVQQDLRRLELNLRWQLSLIQTFNAPGINFLKMLETIRALADRYEYFFTTGTEPTIGANK